MDVRITPQSDGSLNIEYQLDYEAATDFPSNAKYLEVGVPNSDFTLVNYSPSSLISSGCEKKSGTSQVHLDFVKLPKKGDRFKFSFTINQRSMMYNAGDERVSLQFHPGWFDFAVINELKVTLGTKGISTADVSPQPNETGISGISWIIGNIKENQKAALITVIYPTVLSRI